MYNGVEYESIKRAASVNNLSRYKFEKLYKETK